jgi:hypothetical protein
MSSNIEDSIVLITSKDPNLQRKNFGTGFVIYHTLGFTYILTCAHVVRDVGGIEKVLVRGIAATLVVSGESKGFDLAVLQVQGLSSLPVLRLSSSADVAQPFNIAGYYDFDQKETRLLRKIQGYLGKPTFISSSDGSDHIKAWDLRIEDEDILQPGYSGSPVVDQSSGIVLGIVSHQVSKGEKGLAISIEAIQKIWMEMPCSLLQASVDQAPKLVMQNKKIEVFISYSTDDTKLLNEIVDYINSSLEGINIWHKGKILGGQNPKIEIDNKLNSAHIILLLISPNFQRDYNSKTETDINLAKEIQKNTTAIIIPILLTKAMRWERLIFGNSKLEELSPLPKNGKFLTYRKSWTSRNDAFFELTQELEEVIRNIK